MRLDLPVILCGDAFLFAKGIQNICSSMGSFVGLVGPSWIDLGVSNLVEQRFEPCSMYSFRVTVFEA